MNRDPVAELDPRFSSEAAAPTPWSEARRLLSTAEVSWLSTVRPDGRPHVTTLLTVWVDEALYFCTGPDERKAKNLEHNKHCILTSGAGRLNEGLDVVVEGDAVLATDDVTLQRVADVYLEKYGQEWTFAVRDGAFFNEAGGKALVFEVKPSKAFGFGKGEEYSQTRWRF